MKFVQLLFVLMLWPLLCGFNLLGSKKSTFYTAPGEVVQLVWDGNTPSMNKKEEFQDGQYADLDDHDFFQEMLNVAVGKWNEVPGSFLQMQVIEGADIVPDKEDKQHVIVVKSESNASSAAYAAPTRSEDDESIIEDCDIVIADRKTDARDLAFTLVHELGHCLGLGHAHSNYNAIMGYSRDKRNLKLGADDVAGISFLYPNTDEVDAEPKELVSCGVINSNPSSKAFLLIFMLFPVIFSGFFVPKRSH
jgi:predicted Zn-dependent protease